MRDVGEFAEDTERRTTLLEARLTATGAGRGGMGPRTQSANCCLISTTTGPSTTDNCRLPLAEVSTAKAVVLFGRNTYAPLPCTAHHTTSRTTFHKQLPYCNIRGNTQLHTNRHAIVSGEPWEVTCPPVHQRSSSEFGIECASDRCLQASRLQRSGATADGEDPLLSRLSQRGRATAGGGEHNNLRFGARSPRLKPEQGV